MRIMSSKHRVVLLFALVGILALSVTLAAAQKKASPPTGKVRTYYVAADEVEWDYAPSGMDQMMGMPFEGMAKAYTERGSHRIGKVYRKAIYREYTDGTFTKLKPRPPESQYLGTLGPVLRAEVGDTIKVVFENNAARPYSMHAHGVFYQKPSEGSPYNDGVAPADKKGAVVPPGETFTYVWPVPERAGPGPNDPSSVVWLYHSHVNELKDVNAGLVGAMIITARGKAKPDGTPKDVDREFVNLFIGFNENRSWYIDHNIQTYTTDPKGTKKEDIVPVDVEGAFSLAGTGFGDVNIKFCINGYLFANMPMMTMKKGERVRWYLVTLGEGFNFHTPHWHGNNVLQNGNRTDVVALSPAQMLTVDMVPDNPGIWLYHCHVSEHMETGMIARYEVKP